MFVSLDMFDAYEVGNLRKDVSTVSKLLVSGVVEDKYAYISKFTYFDYEPQTQTDWVINLQVIRYTDVK